MKTISLLEFYAEHKIAKSGIHTSTFDIELGPTLTCVTAFLLANVFAILLEAVTTIT